MNIAENVIQAVSSLRANKIRALLTMLGIIIGIGSVIAVVTLGDSLTSSVASSMTGAQAVSDEDLSTTVYILLSTLGLQGMPV